MRFDTSEFSESASVCFSLNVYTFVHSFLSLCSVFEAFGKILACELAQDPTKPGKHK